MYNEPRKRTENGDIKCIQKQKKMQLCLIVYISIGTNFETLFECGSQRVCNLPPLRVSLIEFSVHSVAWFHDVMPKLFETVVQAIHLNGSYLLLPLSHSSYRSSFFTFASSKYLTNIGFLSELILHRIVPKTLS